MTVAPRGKGKAKEGVVVTKDPPERRAVLRKIVHPETGETLDEGVVLYFPRSSVLSSLTRPA